MPILIEAWCAKPEKDFAGITADLDADFADCAEDDVPFKIFSNEFVELEALFDEAPTWAECFEEMAAIEDMGDLFGFLLNMQGPGHS